ncbi:hypothetical protein BKH43_02710 [Helicobacter sp. 13S00401-1]|uniref:HP0495 family protein n=1 Tax=Helicobacter sp. 13S00401-1 TaxID=1905758 RepID=UPI000BA6717B|nr:DUF493 domain-containing protein [Helicobacter sp. 13S00401-1]PAF51135.1 hypothetical protein BKH43_02710 [Helicobacter sp. 13S00401-1]
MNDEKKIEYPCVWEYKIFTSDKDYVLKEIANLSSEIKILSSDRQSKNGKYTVIDTSLHVENEEERNSMFTKLRSLKEVHLVI